MVSPEDFNQKLQAAFRQVETDCTARHAAIQETILQLTAQVEALFQQERNHRVERDRRHRETIEDLRAENSRLWATVSRLPAAEALKGECPDVKQETTTNPPKDKPDQHSEPA
ncbi:hypothetical protein NW767_009648 [Fusarium falciforme]|nr:hypothetical protein NW767_009648 [Fusarium falciforme]